MNRSQRMTPLARIAEQKKDSAAEELKVSQQQLRAYQKRLDDVVAYRQEYLQRFTRTGAAGIPAQQMKDFQIFLAKLDSAIIQLQQLIEESTVTCQARKQDWVARRARHRALDEVVAKYRKQELRDELRAGEREADDLTQRKHHRR